MGAHYRDQTTESTCSTGADVRNLVQYTSPKLKLELVSMKRLTACLWRPTWLMSDRTCTVPRGDISPYSLPSVHVARSTVGARCRLRFPLYVNHLTLTLPSLFHSLSVYLFKHPCFEHSILFSQIPRLLEA